MQQQTSDESDDSFSMQDWATVAYESMNLSHQYIIDFVSQCDGSIQSKFKLQWLCFCFDYRDKIGDSTTVRRRVFGEFRSAPCNPFGTGTTRRPISWDVAGMIDDLVSAGLIEETPYTGDTGHTRTELSLTPAGQMIARAGSYSIVSFEAIRKYGDYDERDFIEAGLLDHVDLPTVDN